MQDRQSVAPRAASAPAGAASAPPSGVRAILFGGARTDSPAADAGLLVLRVVAGLALALTHGLGKVPPSDRFIAGVGEMGFPLPEFFASLAALAEFGGGIFLALGLLTRPAAFLVLGQMAVVTLMAHAGDPFGDREAPVLYGAIALLFLAFGAGRYSLDALIHRRAL
jgi:putative oxidoreductase